jgi:cytochrome b561
MSQDGTLKPEYTGFGKFLHWSVAACVMTAIPVGLIMMRMAPGDEQNSLFNLHRSLGMLILVLMVMRTVYRLMSGAPASEPTLTVFQRAASQSMHQMLYLLLLAQPVVGWAASSAYGASISMFGLYQVPALLAKDEALSKQLIEVHNLLGLVIAGLVALHVAAALYHRFIRHDGVMQRMLPRPTFRDIDS